MPEYDRVVATVLSDYQVIVDPEDGTLDVAVVVMCEGDKFPMGVRVRIKNVRKGRKYVVVKYESGHYAIEDVAPPGPDPWAGSEDEIITVTKDQVRRSGF